MNDSLKIRVAERRRKPQQALLFWGGWNGGQVSSQFACNARLKSRPAKGC
jgi:hypothetical protein